MFLSIVLVLILAPVSWAADGVIRIGFNIPQSGMFELVGVHSRNAADLVQQQLKKEGGLKIGSKQYNVEFLYGDNGSNPTTASTLTIKQITGEGILGIIGPLSSRQAIPVGQMANGFATPMVSPWSTSPLTTKDRPWIFRSCFVYPVQGPVLTKFVGDEFGATRAAVLYDIVSAYPRGMAKSFKEAFEAKNGPGSVVAFEDFRTGDDDFSEQLGKIREAGAQVIFAPQHYNEIPLIVRQVKAMGLDIPVVGSNSWAGGDLKGSCGDDCTGLFFTGNYAPGNAKGLNRDFVESYVSAYGENPDEPAALTWDAVRVFLQAVKDTGGLSGNIVQDRKRVRDALVKVQKFPGATGELSFNETGDPNKCAVIVRIDEEGVFTFHDSVCP